MNAEWKIPKKIHIPPKKKMHRWSKQQLSQKTYILLIPKKKKNQKRSKRKKENRQRTFS